MNTRTMPPLVVLSHVQEDGSIDSQCPRTPVSPCTLAYPYSVQSFIE